MAYGRRARRVIRRIDPWSVLKVSALFYASLMLVGVLAGVTLWVVGSTVGAVDSVESFIGGLWAEENFRFASSQLLRGFVAGALVLVMLGTGTTVLAAVLFNLISDVVGGVEVVVLEESVHPAATPAAELVSLEPEEPTVVPGYPA